ncbi:hypothetical protein ZIOFF_047357 [Zingiber officinale]|uniref:Uncharacterized protein n=1 Tax=Zingiber officinale TaxID=94328 RepID=A0A8J5KWN2_ZINOF|nr:hypothetical protein ZIOFF_047357 [Zingiber officinale]
MSREPSATGRASVMALWELEKARSWLTVDIIALDFSQKLPFRLKIPPIKLAIQRGLYFEITYSHLIVDSHVTRKILSDAKVYQSSPLANAIRKKQFYKETALGAWFPPWLATHTNYYKELSTIHWKEHGQLVLDVLLQKVSKKSIQAQQFMEPHFESSKAVSGQPMTIFSI